MKLRPEVQKFAEEMELKLQKNDHKGGWNDESIDYFEKRLLDEGRELAHVIAIFRDHPESITDETRKDFLKESADFMNFLMMIADITGCLGLEHDA